MVTFISPLFLAPFLPHSFLFAQIWKLSDPAKTGCVGRDGLYKSLALTALAQQGKTVDESVFKTFGEKGEGKIGGGKERKEIEQGRRKTEEDEGEGWREIFSSYFSLLQTFQFPLLVQRLS